MPPDRAVDPVPANDGAHVLVLLRHAKSDWPDDVPDHDRPLAVRGRADAPAVGAWLGAHGLRPDRVVVSDARRTVQTWELVEATLGSEPPVDVHVEPRAYCASPQVLLDLVHETPESVRTLLVVGHNPGTARLATGLDDLSPAGAAPRARLEDKYPTAALAVLAVSGPWAGLEPGEARLLDFATPHG
jgi:phosphohistidine phosphatase